MGAEEAVDLGSGEGTREAGAVWELNDVERSVGRVHDHGELHGVVGWADKVVGRAARSVGVESRLATILAWGKNLNDIELSAARSPARAGSLAVLEGTWDLSVEHPNGWHVAVESGGGFVWHLELEHEDLVCAIESVVGDGARADVAAVIARALTVGHDGELLVGADQLVAEDGWGRSASVAISVEVGERVSVVGVEGARALSTVVSEEDNSIGAAGLGIVKADTGVCSVWINGLLVLVDLWRSGLDASSLGSWALSTGNLIWVGWNLGGGRSSSWAEPVVLPSHNLSVNCGGDGVWLGLLLLMELGVSVATSVWSAEVGAFGRAARLGVGGDLLELQWATEVKRDFLVEWSEGAGVLDWLGGASTASHGSDLVVGARVADVGVGDGLDWLAVEVASFIHRALSTLVGLDESCAEGKDGHGGLNGELHDGCSDVLSLWFRKVSCLRS